MKVYIVYEGLQNQEFWVVSVWADEQKADRDVEQRDRENKDDTTYFFSEEWEVQ